MIPGDLSVAIPCRNLIGESPVWSVRERALYWVDVEGRLVQRFDPSTDGVDRWTMPEATGCIGLRRQGGLVAAIRTGFVALDTRTGEVAAITDPERDVPGNRFNDGKVDRRGRFFAGTKNIANRPDPTGAVYRLEADGTAHLVHRGVSCANGIAWSPDEQTLYLCDTWRRIVFALRYDPDRGTASDARVFAQVPPEAGYPDGLTVDAEGYVWNAHYDGFRITRYAPDGAVERVVELPVRHVTSLCFGGPELRTLYVTTASARLSADDLARQPLAGHVLAFAPGCTGLPEPEFAG
jgi:L-arabinonolactonase